VGRARAVLRVRIAPDGGAGADWSYIHRGHAGAAVRDRFASATVRGRYRPTPDGQRFLVLGPLARKAEQPASVVLNWTSALPR
jgi:hypothetical protein